MRVFLGFSFFVWERTVWVRCFLKVCFILIFNGGNFRNFVGWVEGMVRSEGGSVFGGF